MVSKNEVKYWIELFHYAIKWNAFESVIYQVIYLAHQLVLFKTISITEYAKLGLFFSILYFLIPIINGGLDKSFITYFNNFAYERKRFNALVIKQLVLQLVIIFFCIVLFLLINVYFFTLASDVMLFGCILLVTESLKKSLKTIAQLYFLNKITAIIECCAIIMYTSLFWIIYYSTKTFSLYTAAVPLIIESVLSIIVLMFVIATKYPKKIDRNMHPVDQLPHGIKLVQDIAFTRLSIFLSQLSSLIFSSNLMLPMMSYMFGLESGAIMQISKSVVAFLVFFLEKTFGITSGSFLSHTKSNNIQTKQLAFNQAALPVYKTIFTIIFTMLVLFLGYTLYYGNPCTAYMVTNGFLFILAILTSSFFIPKEQFLIVEQKVYYLLGINILNGIIFYIVILRYVSFTIALISFIVTRFASLVALDVIIQRTTHINIKYHEKKYIPIFITVFSFCMLSLIIYYYCTYQKGIL